jgi:hypothetical protein
LSAERGLGLTAKGGDNGVTKPMAKVGKKASEPDLNQLLNEVYDAIERLAKLGVELEGVWASL